jgi:hypothetical protein
MAITSPLPRLRLAAAPMAMGAHAQGFLHCSAQRSAVPPQQPPGDVSNVAPCPSGPWRVEVARRAGLKRRDSWAILRPVRVEVEDVVKFLTGEAAVAHAAPDRAPS